ncbi:BUD13 homolog [Mugil cephalus]|uniref:BUD13 homolog n=1 Tax=Mugil cephalus TaxID=48193 RepID=UPI001FB6F2CE|nr:BUD13 homolog [Mugil cephalus]XP_047463840.1 BUD13 homolog [Mugil cephalus]XP_047463841.1 BUD13 homolog [Mugil cephalus]
MAASSGTSKRSELSKAEYLKRYLSAEEDPQKSIGKIRKKRRTVPEKGLKIVDDDIDWKQMINEQTEIEEDEEEAPVIAEVIDDRPEQVKRLEAFRTSNRWKIIGADEDENTEKKGVSGPEHTDLMASSKSCHNSPDLSSKRRRLDSPDISPPRRSRHDSPDLSPLRQHSRKSGNMQSINSPLSRAQNWCDSDSDQSPPRKKPLKGKASNTDLSPPKRHSKTRRLSGSDQSPPRRWPQSIKDSDGDLSPPRRPGQSQGQRMLSGGKAGLVSVEVLRKEQEENRCRERNNQPLEDESRNAQTIFRDKSGKRRDLDFEREEQKKKAGKKAAKDEKYAQWGKGLAQNQMQQQRIEDAVREAHKPLARHRDDEDLDRMLREQEREGDPMAAMLRQKKGRNTKTQEKPRYKGPAPPPNRFNIQPGFRWDGVDRSNGFEQKRYSRIADKKASQEAAYKWSVEDM